MWEGESVDIKSAGQGLPGRSNSEFLPITRKKYSRGLTKIESDNTNEELISTEKKTTETKTKTKTNH